MQPDGNGVIPTNEDEVTYRLVSSVVVDTYRYIPEFRQSLNALISRSLRISEELAAREFGWCSTLCIIAVVRHAVTGIYPDLKNTMEWTHSISKRDFSTDMSPVILTIDPKDVDELIALCSFHIVNLNAHLRIKLGDRIGDAHMLGQFGDDYVLIGVAVLNNRDSEY